MSHYSGSVPDSQPTTDWRKNAACLTEDPAIFDAAETTPAGRAYAAQAKTICGTCPARTDCLTFALTERIEHGTYGGYTERERAAIRRTARKHKISMAESAARLEPVWKKNERTFQSVFDAHTRALWGGHLAWTGPAKPQLGGQVYTPRQFCFTAGRGYFPDGRVEPECGVPDCVLPQHLSDHAERTGFPARVAV